MESKPDEIKNEKLERAELAPERIAQAREILQIAFNHYFGYAKIINAKTREVNHPKDEQNYFIQPYVLSGGFSPKTFLDRVNAYKKSIHGGEVK